MGVTLTGYGGSIEAYDAAATSISMTTQMISAGTTDQSRYDGQSGTVDAIKVGVDGFHHGF